MNESKNAMSNVANQHAMSSDTRGSTRPMASGADNDMMDHSQRFKMLEQHHGQTLWVYWTLVMLGIWLMLAPFTFGYDDPSQWVNPSGGRGAWWSDAQLTSLRADLMIWSDVVAGVLLTIFGWRSLQPNRPLSLWTCCGIGVWLTFAPVLFWAPTAAAYLNDTLVGALVIALSILIPGMPNMIMFMQMGPPTPPGWTYNPSSWPQRWIMIATGFAGWIVSRYLAAFQLGYIRDIWDPIFGSATGSEAVLNSDLSHMWPLSDAAFGAIAYTFEFLMGFMGGPSRWRTMPWMVAFFGVLVIPLGLTHILLVISQPVVVHHWCSMCLLAAAIMLPMIPLEVDEVAAMGQHLVEAKRRGDRGGSLWQIFWKGGSAEGCTPDARSPQLIKLSAQPWSVFKASIWGMSFPWTLVVSALIGFVMMLVPTWAGWDINTRSADCGHLGGALILTIAVISMAEVTRIGRYLNVVGGLTVAVGIWFTKNHNGPGDATLAALGVTVILLSLFRGSKREQYGLWDRFL